jgi:hypothetical protein
VLIFAAAFYFRRDDRDGSVKLGLDDVALEAPLCNGGA